MGGEIDHSVDRLNLDHHQIQGFSTERNGRKLTVVEGKPAASHGQTILSSTGSMNQSDLKSKVRDQSVQIKQMKNLA